MLFNSRSQILGGSPWLICLSVFSVFSKPFSIFHWNGERGPTTSSNRYNLKSQLAAKALQSLWNEGISVLATFHFCPLKNFCHIHICAKSFRFCVRKKYIKDQLITEEEQVSSHIDYLQLSLQQISQWVNYWQCRWQYKLNVCFADTVALPHMIKRAENGSTEFRLCTHNLSSF